MQKFRTFLAKEILDHQALINMFQDMIKNQGINYCILYGYVDVLATSECRSQLASIILKLEGEAAKPNSIKEDLQYKLLKLSEHVGKRSHHEMQAVGQILKFLVENEE